MSDQPKLHVYAVSCAFGAPGDTDPPARLLTSVWLGYRPEEATAIAIDAAHRTMIDAGQKVPRLAGVSTYEITEEHLSHLLNALRTGGKGATVLQAVPPEPKPEPVPYPDTAVQRSDQNYWNTHHHPYPPGDPA